MVDQSEGPITVVATLHPKPGYSGEVREALLAVAPRVHHEHGCELYAVHEAADRFVVVEKWATRGDLAAHTEADNMATLNASLEARLSKEPDVQVLDPVPAGDERLGAI
ncbi:hypothetical protein BIV57_07810 [Mangrovactinospora gilvigrisea]|uniref:ABM domain-containing protein n=2 Tax=Mangrovactinospora gilvigrisea TaxID=1428644 RepID=A0A1J7C967_9ACTN|nr:hypothetical protein BIV57_07810 [Mangrovactinospora gilvigrisea]